MAERSAQVTLHRASPEDALAIAQLRVQSWRSAYRGIVPQSSLDAMSSEETAAHWLKDSNGGWGHDVLLAREQDGRLAGFSWSGPAREEARGYRGELYAIYLRPDRIGCGIGRLLFEATSREMRARGFANMFLWMFETNARAAGFYRRMGGRLVPGMRQITEIGGEGLPEVAFGFDLSSGIEQK